MYYFFYTINKNQLLYKILPKRNSTFHRGSDDFVKGVIEKTLSQQISDGTYWRGMLLGEYPDLDLYEQKNTLVKLATRDRQSFNREKKDFLFSKFDLLNTWQGILLYFFILVLTIFILKRYFILNVNVIEIQNIENQIIDK